MAINNTVTLIGNMGMEARLIETEEGTQFAAFTLATTDSYKAESSEEWQEKETIWHNIIAFSPMAIEKVKRLKKGTRITVTGSLNYRPFDVITTEGKPITKKEASIIIRNVELTPLVNKQAQ